MHGFRIVLLSRLTIPGDCHGVVLWHALTLFVHGAYPELGVGMAGLRRLLIPGERGGIAYGHSTAMQKDVAEFILRLGMTAFGRPLEQVQRLDIVLPHT